MEASIVDLRTKMSQVLKALDRNESVTITYRGKKKAVMYPVGSEPSNGEVDITKQPYFGMWADREDMKDPVAYVRKLRRARYRVL